MPDRIRLLHGDNLAEMGLLLEAGETFTLAYLDPPFFTGREFKTADGEVAFDDRWTGLDHYLVHVLLSARKAYQLLAPGGSLVLHVDPTTSHYLKVRGDELFGRDNFASEIVWRYRRWPAKCRNFQAMHDVLLRWVKPGAQPTFNQLYDPLSETTIATWANRSQHARFDRSGKRTKSVVSWQESPGAAMSDVWEISVVSSGRAAGSERTGYPTQKPEALLERLVLSLTNEGDAVLDPYMGSGTTLAVCHRLNRRAVGIDASSVAHRYAAERLAPLFAQGNLFEVGT